MRRSVIVHARLQDRAEHFVCLLGTIVSCSSWRTRDLEVRKRMHASGEERRPEAPGLFRKLRIAVNSDGSAALGRIGGGVCGKGLKRGSMAEIGAQVTRPEVEYHHMNVIVSPLQQRLGELVVCARAFVIRNMLIIRRLCSRF